MSETKDPVMAIATKAAIEACWAEPDARPAVIAAAIREALAEPLAALRAAEAALAASTDGCASSNPVTCCRGQYSIDAKPCRDASAVEAARATLAKWGQP